MRYRGFTLIELLVIISVIGLLSTIVITNVSGARYKARVAAAQASLNNAFLGAVLCLADDKPLLGAGTGEDECILGGSFFLAPEGQPICSGSDNTWPDIRKYNFGFNICASSVNENKFVILTSDTFTDIICSYNFNDATSGGTTVDTQGRCEVRPNGQVGICTDEDNNASGGFCKISGSHCTEGAPCSECNAGETCERIVI